MDNWMKHELFDLSNRTSWWHDSWQYVFTWHTSHDVKAWLYKHKIWHLTSSIYVPMSELELWFYFCFARYPGPKIHSDYRRLSDLHACNHAWPWSWRSRHGLRDLCYLCLYLSYHEGFLLFRKDFRSGNFIPTIAVCVASMLDLETEWHVLVYVTYVIYACICATARICFVP